MKVLVITPYPPTPPFAGGRRRILEQLRVLSCRNEVDLACLTYSHADEGQLDQLGLSTVRVFSIRRDRDQRTDKQVLAQPRLVEKFWNKALMERIATLADSTQYDWVIAEHCYTAAYLDGISARKMVTEHNIEYRILEQIASHDGDLSESFFLAGRPGELLRDAAQQFPLLRRFEEDVWRRMDLCVTVSEVERQVVAKVAHKQNLLVVPNCPGFSVRTMPLRSGPPSIVFFGALNYFPNIDAIVYFVHAILPLIRCACPGAEVVVAGRDPEPQLIEFCKQSGIQVIANPANIDEVITSESVLVCPLRFGAGTRIKLLDAMATGIPVIATSLAAEGLGATAGREFRVANSPQEFCEALSEVFGSPFIRAELTDAGREFLRTENLCWSTVFADLEHRMEAAV